MTVVKGRAATIEAAHDAIAAEAARAGLAVEHVVVQRAPDGAVEYSAVLR